MEDPDAVRAILEGVGLRPVFRYQKYREAYAWRDAEIVLDETPVGSLPRDRGACVDDPGGRGGLGYRPADYISESYAGAFPGVGRQG